MLEKVTKNYITSCGSFLQQLYLISAFSVSAKYILVHANTALDERSITNLTDNSKCYLNSDICEHNDAFCLSVTYIDAMPDNEDYDTEINYKATYAIKCKEQPKDMTNFFDTNLRPKYYQSVVFHIKNIFEFPVKLLHENISYSFARLEYAHNTDRIVQVLSHLPNLRRLNVLIGSYVADEKWLGTLLRSQKALRYLMLQLNCSNDVDFTFPMDGFSTLNELQELHVKLNSMSMAFSSMRFLTRQHFQNVTKLERLSLSYNNMQTIEHDLFSLLHELSVLKLNSNELRNLSSDLFVAQSKLISLELNNNQLEYLPTDLFAHTPRLSILELRSNKLFDIGNLLSTLKPLNYLIELDLSGNKFESNAHANDNLLTHMNRKSYENVHHTELILNLAYNYLINFTWDDNAACNTKILLSYNRIRYFHAFTLPTTVTRPNCMRHLEFDGYSLHCDCQLVWFYYLYILPAFSIQTDTSTWHCVSPQHLAGRFLRTLQLEDVCEHAATVCPATCNCMHAYGDDGFSALVVNCTGAYINDTSTQLPRSQQVRVAQTTLYIERCNLTELPLNLISDYANITRLYAAENNITTLSAHLPSTLLLLDLRANNLKSLSEDFLKFLTDSSGLQALYLSDNPWHCDCEAAHFLHTLRMHRFRILDIEKLFCHNFVGLALFHFDPADICATSSMAALAVVTLLLFALLLLILTALYYKYKLEVKIWLYAHNLCVFWIEEEKLDQNKPFDAFISYAHQQSQYISEVLLPGLEQGHPSFRICIHDRNWLAGTCIPDQIAKSVELSCRTIIVLSQDFIESKWARMEFRMAHQCALNEGRTRVIVIKYDELPNLERLDIELQAYLRTNTYLESNDPRFWPKLRYAMSHKGSGQNIFYIPDEMELDN